MHMLGLGALPPGSRPRRRSPETETGAALAGSRIGSHHVARGASVSSSQTSGEAAATHLPAMSSANEHHNRHRRTSRRSRGPRTAKTPTPEPAASEIEAKTTELRREFLNHVRDCREQYPEDHDPRTSYGSWAI